MSRELMEIAVRELSWLWPQSQECNGLLHFDWKNNQYYSDFYGENEFVQKIGTKEEFVRISNEMAKRDYVKRKINKLHK